MSRLINNKTPLLGIIGGMGPMASAYFCELLIRMTDVPTDQEHLPSILLNLPTIPDRTAYILGKSEENPAPILHKAAHTLASLGADCIAVTCVTSHGFYDEVTSDLPIEWIHAVKETALYLQERGVKKAGILATSGTLATGLFQKALGGYGIEAIAPDETLQQDVMSIIYDNVKAGLPADMGKFSRVTKSLMADGAEVCILGCTELSLIKKEQPLPRCLDVLEVLGRAAILRCGKPLRKEYDELIG